MATGNIAITASIQGGADGSWALPASAGTTFLAPAAIQGETIVALTNGANTVTVPTGATAAIIVPPNASYPQPNPNWGGTLTLKGVTGDTGVAISNKWLTPICWDSTNVPSTFVITSSAIGVLQVRFM